MREQTRTRRHLLVGCLPLAEAEEEAGALLWLVVGERCCCYSSCWGVPLVVLLFCHQQCLLLRCREPSYSPADCGTLR